jgi:hypothetical protein
MFFNGSDTLFGTVSKRWGLRASYLSTDTNADAGQNVRLTT